MACRLSEIVIDCADPERLAEFWCAVLDWDVVDREHGTVEIGPPGIGFGGPQPTLFFSRSDDPKLQKLRWHIDVNATDRDQADELERLLAIGAKPVDVGQGDDASWHVLADPEGNEFCLLRSRLDPV
jgi:catechol 2,3-dioxygenase-like lactoylglutathione lyase family enzyme